VVPTSGGTVSYASILSFDQKERRRIAASVHGGSAEHLDDPDEEDFVDARESQVPMAPALRKRLGKDKSDRNLHNVVEELHLENASLKEMLDKLSKRLHAFEINSQSSHLALAQSLRLQRPASPMSSSGGGGGKAEPGDEALKKKNRELEEQLALAAQRMDMLEQEHAKLQQTLEKYRDRWEKLKAGAKARREGQGSVNREGESARPTK
jgi:predicted RNase H-like nuclease (RuvC/YqgF family)